MALTFTLHFRVKHVRSGDYFSVMQQAGSRGPAHRAYNCESVSEAIAFIHGVRMMAPADTIVKVRLPAGNGFTLTANGTEWHEN